MLGKHSTLDLYLQPLNQTFLNRVAISVSLQNVDAFLFIDSPHMVYWPFHLQFMTILVSFFLGTKMF
jgi:hypothetical protein